MHIPPFAASLAAYSGAFPRLGKAMRRRDESELVAAARTRRDEKKAKRRRKAKAARAQRVRQS